MTLPKTDIEPAYTYTYPSRKAYFDETGSTLTTGRVADPAKSGADYGITDPEVTEPVDGTDSKTGNGSGTP